MDRRNWFLWIDRLKITRVERTAVSALILIALVVLAMRWTLEPGPPFGNADYQQMDRLFARKTRQYNQEQARIAARYEAGMEHKGQAAGVSENTPVKSRSGSGSPASAKVDINKAAVDALTTLPGIGPVLARRIIAFRNAQGGIEQMEELIQVKGIGQVTLQKMRSRIAGISNK